MFEYMPVKNHKTASVPSPARSGTIELLCEALKHEHAPVRRSAASILGRLGAQARAAIPCLRTPALYDPDRLVRQAAAQALELIQAAHEARPIRAQRKIIRRFIQALLNALRVPSV